MALLSKKIRQAINKQIKYEFESAYLYLGMVSYFDLKSLPGFASWMRAQSQEEWGHGLRLFNFLLDHDEKIDLEGLSKPTIEFKSPIDVFEHVLKHEHEITQQVFQLYELSMEERAHTAKVELEWFIREQVEEEKTARDILDQLKLAGTNSAALLVLDRELGGRAAKKE